MGSPMRHLDTFRLIEEVARAGSIRKAAEDINITSSALNRRILRFEEEFGSQIFERLPHGVRLNTAGELLIQHYRAQRSDLSRVQSQVADLSGVRRGHVSIACSQATIPYFLTEQIASYRAEHPGVTFSVRVRDRAAAERDLSQFESDLALVFEPVHMVDFEVIAAIPQPVCAIMAPDHPLAGTGPVRLHDCLAGPHVLPTREYGVRHLLESATKGRSIRLRHYVLHEHAVGFQIPIGLRLEAAETLAIREVSHRDLPAGTLFLGHLKGRTLPVASARFAIQVAAAAMARLAGAEAGGTPDRAGIG